MSDSSSDEDQTVEGNIPSDKAESSAVKRIDTGDGVEDQTFEDLGVCSTLCQVISRLGWETATKVQSAALPHALKGRDIIGLAETGSGKTAAFAIPILQALLETPQKLFALVLTPTRELAFQIGEQFEALGSSINLIVAVIVGGVDMSTQALALAKRPHVIVGEFLIAFLLATPGRLVDHLENTKGFNLRALKCLVLDEADRILNMDFEAELDKILKVIPRDRRTFLYSATMTKKVSKLERASLKDPVRIEVSSKYQTVDKLKQYYLFIPHKYKEAYLVYILNEMAGQTAIVFCSTCASSMKLALTLRTLGFSAVPLHGQMSQAKRLGALNKFRSKDRSILVCTDVASRGLDIPHVDVVLNFDVPTQSKDYVHRVGRTARAGRSGSAITFVTQYDVEIYLRIEQLIGKKLALYETVENDVMLLVERVEEAQNIAKKDMKELLEKKKKRKRDFDDSDNDEDETTFRKKIKMKRKGKQFRKNRY